MIATEPVILNLKDVGLSNEQFYQLCQVNEQWRLEETAQGELIIMPPVSAISGNRESEFNADTDSIILNLKDVGLSDEQFYQLCQVNKQWRLEETAQGELIIMPPVGAISGNRESDLNGHIWLWNRQTQLGKVFSSSTVFILPNGGKRSPDVAWISNKRWNQLTSEQQEKFAPICPDFVIELRSRTDSLGQLQSKMQEYLNSGLRLGWFINPQDQQVEIYRQNQPMELLSLPATLSGEDILPDFTLALPIF